MMPYINSFEIALENNRSFLIGKLRLKPINLWSEIPVSEEEMEEISIPDV